MERVSAAASWECFLNYVVLEKGEPLAADATAVEQHPSCMSVGVPQGTTLLDGLRHLRNLVGSKASVAALNNERKVWMPLVPDLLSHSCAAGDTFYFRFVRSPGMSVAASWECFLNFVVLEKGEALAADATAVEQHSSCMSVGVPQGTTLLDGLRHLRNLVGSNASVAALNNERKVWMPLVPEILSYSCAAGDTFYFRFVRSPDAIDNSKAWACAVLKPFAFSVLELEGLRRALSEPLPLPLPVGDATYKDYFDSSPDFVPHNSYPSERIASLITSFIRSSTEIGMSEKNLHQSIWGNAFCNLWLEILGLAEITTIELSRNVTDHSGDSSTTDTTNTDLMLWILNRLCAMFEEKSLTIHEAQLELEMKLSNLQAEYYGPVQWIIGVGLAGDRMAAWAMRQGQQTAEILGMPLRMTSVKDKAACVRFSVNLLRVALSLTEACASLVYLPRPYRTLQPLLYGEGEQIRRMLWIIENRAIKEIIPWSEHVAEGFTQLDFVRKAYELQAPGLISGQVVLRGQRYKVTMDAVGFQQTIDSEAELVLCLQDLLSGLKALHAAGLVHRDIRWKNVLRIPGDGYVLIDFETVWKCGDEPFCLNLRGWDERTLVNGKFTESSDLQLVGKLMSTVNLSQEARSFQLKLLNHQLATADDALEQLAVLRSDLAINQASP